MNKELTPLEALEIIYNSQDIMGGHDKFWEAYRVIEKAVKEYLGFQIVFKLSNRNEGKKVHDKLKALKIIVNKVPLLYLLCGFMGKYNEEEINLIKEVYKDD